MVLEVTMNLYAFNKISGLSITVNILLVYGYGIIGKKFWVMMELSTEL